MRVTIDCIMSCVVLPSPVSKIARVNNCCAKKFIYMAPSFLGAVAVLCLHGRQRTGDPFCFLPCCPPSHRPIVLSSCLPACPPGLAVVFYVGAGRGRSAKSSSGGRPRQGCRGCGSGTKATRRAPAGRTWSPRGTCSLVLKVLDERKREGEGKGERKKERKRGACFRVGAPVMGFFFVFLFSLAELYIRMCALE